MRRRAANETIVIALTASIALAACETERRCVDAVTHELLPDEQCRDGASSTSHGSYHPHIWWYGGERGTTPRGKPFVYGGSSHPSSSSHGTSSHHSASYHGSGGHGFGGFHGGFGG